MGDTGGAREYLSRLTGVAAGLTPPVQTGCPAVDVLLGEKLAIAESMGIHAEAALALPAPCGVESLDWCILFANALDNALQACTRGGGQGTFLRVSGRRQGDFYLLEVENTCPEGPLPPPGTGLQNIRAVAGKYRGTMSAEAAGGVFRLHVLLDIS